MRIGTPPLTQEQEIEAWHAMKAGDGKAKERIVLACIGIARKISFNVARRLKLDVDECDEIAYATLVRFVDSSWDARISRFSSYVGGPIKWAIYRYRTQCGIACSRPQGQPTTEEGVKAWRRAGYSRELMPGHSMAGCVNHKPWSEEGVTVTEFYEAIDQLPGRQSKIVRDVLAGKKFCEIAAEDGVSGESCRQVYVRATRRLRRRFCGAN